MSALTANAEALMSVLLPELKKLCINAPQFGEIFLRAKIHDGDVGLVSTAVEFTRKISPKARGDGGVL